MGNSKQVVRYDAPEHHHYENPEIGVEFDGGERKEVSGKVAEELLTDPSADFSVVDGDEADLVPSREDELAAKDREELVQIATDAGVHSPGLIGDTDELVDAILDKEAPDEDKIARLERDNTRDELDDLARAAGIEDPDSFDNKEAVAAAIVNQKPEAEGEGQPTNEGEEG